MKLNPGNLLQKWDSIQSGDRVKLEPGFYQVNSPLQLVDRHDVKISGYGAYVQTVAHRAGIILSGCSDIEIEGLEIYGQGYNTKPNTDYFALVQLEGSPWCRFVRMLVGNSGAHGIAHLNGPRTSDGCQVLECRFVDGGNLNCGPEKIDGAAIALGGQSTVIKGCYIANWLRGIELETGAEGNHPLRDVQILENRIVRCLFQFITVMPCWKDPVMRAKLCGDIVIARNYLEGWGEETPSPLVGEGKNVGIYWGGGSDSSILGNTICRMRQGIGIHIAGDYSPASNVQIRHNQLHDMVHGGYMGSNAVTPNPFAISDVPWLENRIRRCSGYGLRLAKGACSSDTEDYNNVDLSGLGKNVRWDDVPVAGGKYK